MPLSRVAKSPDPSSDAACEDAWSGVPDSVPLAKPSPPPAAQIVTAATTLLNRPEVQMT